VLQEILYRYSALRRPDLVRQVYDLFVAVCPVVFPVDLSETDRARDLLCGGENISARDAGHAAVMLNHGLTEIATFDEGFDRIEGIRRIRL
jgi:predicted nucleic acid-binding protein